MAKSWRIHYAWFCKFERSCWAMLDTFRRDLLQPFLNRVVERHRYSDIEASANERKPERFTGHFGELHANAAQNALAGFENHTARLS